MGKINIKEKIGILNEKKKGLISHLNFNYIVQVSFSVNNVGKLKLSKAALEGVRGE